MSTALKNLGSLTKEEVRNVCALGWKNFSADPRGGLWGSYFATDLGINKFTPGPLGTCLIWASISDHEQFLFLFLLVGVIDLQDIDITILFQDIIGYQLQLCWITSRLFNKSGADLDKSKDQRISYAEFRAWIKNGMGSSGSMPCRACFFLMGDGEVVTMEAYLKWDFSI